MDKWTIAGIACSLGITAMAFGEVFDGDDAIVLMKGACALLIVCIVWTGTADIIRNW